MMLKQDEVYWHGIDFIKDLVDQIPAAIFWKNTSSVFLGCNKYFADFAALSSPQDIIGKTDFDLPWGEFQSELYIQNDQQVMASKQAKLDVEEPQTLRNGEELVLLTNKIPLFAKSGEVIGILGIYHDITSRKKMELSLEEAKAKAEWSSRVKTEFIANMSHDIRTPLSGVVGMSQLLANSLENPEYKQYARWINESGEQLLNLLNDILDVASMENQNEIDLCSDAFDLYNCINDIVQFERPTAKLKNIDLRVEIKDSVPRFLVGDRTKLHRILLNLVGNAIKFTQNGYVAIEIMLLDSNDEQANVQFKVIDTGIGISEEMQLKVFERFYRINPSYKGVYSGHGIGLHVAKSNVALLGGALVVSSKLGVGTTFAFAIKMSVDFSKQQDLLFKSSDLGQSLYSSWITATQTMQDTKESHELEQFKIMPHLLIVEDNAIAMRMAELISTQSGCSFITAVNGEIALELIKSANFDLILTDIGLPGMSGYDLSRHIREWEIAQNKPAVPIVGLTAHTQAQAKKDCLESGMNDVFCKPISLQKMQSILIQFVSSSELKNSLETDIKMRFDLPENESQLFELDQFPLLDIEHASERMGSKAMLYEMLQLMVTQEIPRDEAAIRLAHAEQDWLMIEKLVHKMKGGAVYCGTFKMQYACQYLERYNKAGYSLLLEKLYQQLLDVLQQTKQAIQVVITP